MKEVVRRNPRAVFMVENVVVHEALKHEESIQESMLGERFNEVGAHWLGWPQRRTRRIACNMAGWHEALRRKATMDPNLFLRPLGMTMKDKMAPCVMASGAHTRNPVMLWDVTGSRRVKNPIEAVEVMQGYWPGVSAGNGKVDYDHRISMVGDAFHSVFVTAVIGQWKPVWDDAPGSVVVGAVVGEVDHSTPVERKLREMTDSRLREWMQEQLVGYEAPQLRLSVMKGVTPACQSPPRGRYTTPQNLKDAVVAAIKMKLKVGSMKLTK